MSDSELIDLISWLVGFILSMVFAYAPRLKERFREFEAQDRALIMLLAIVSASLAVGAGGCFGLIPLACSEASLWQLVRLIVQMSISSQATFLLFVRKPKDAHREPETEEPEPDAGPFFLRREDPPQ